MAKSNTKNLVVDAHAINYARIASPTAKFETKGASPLELEYKADILVDEETVEKIESTYKNLRKKMLPITAKKYKEKYKVDMPKGVEGPHILKLTIDVAYEYKDRKTGEKVVGEKKAPTALLQEGKGKARDITYSEYIGNGSVGRVLIMHRISQYNGKEIDCLELGSLLITKLVEVEQKPGQGGSNEPDLAAAFGLDEIEESESEAPEHNEAPLGAEAFEVAEDDDVPFDADEDEDDDEEDF